MRRAAMPSCLLTPAPPSRPRPAAWQPPRPAPASAIYLTSRGAESWSRARSIDVAARAPALSWPRKGSSEDAQSTEKGGDKQEFKGKKGDLDVTHRHQARDAHDHARSR